MNQDFTKRISIVVIKELENWRVLNTVAHISAYFGSTLGEDFDSGDYFTTKDGVSLPRNTQYPIIILEGDTVKSMRKLARKARDSDLSSMYFIKEMIETSDDAEIVESMSNQQFDEVMFLGVGVFGLNEDVQKIVGGCKLWS